GGSSTDLWVVKVDEFGDVVWEKQFTGFDSDSANSIQQTLNGGYILVGYTYSYGAGGSDGWIIRLDEAGNPVWQKTFGGPGVFDSFNDVREVADGGFVIAGVYESGSISNGWIIKLNSSGTLQWQKIIPGNSNLVAKSIQQTNDGGYIVGGTADIGLNNELWLTKLDSSGNIQWQKAYGGSDPFDQLSSMQQTVDGGFILAGTTRSFGQGSFDYLVIRLDSAGNIQWQKSYGTSATEVANAVQQTTDGGYIVIGSQEITFGTDQDGLALKLDSTGNIQWQKNYGGPHREFLLDADTTLDNSYILTGLYSDSSLWLAKIDSSGILDSACGFSRNASVIASNSNATVTVTSFVASDPQISAITSTATTVDTFATILNQCGNIPFCNFEDDFEDGTIDHTKWTVLKPLFIESGGEFVATPIGKKSIAVSTGLSTCNQNYRFQTTMQTDGGQSNRVWLLGWFQDKKNTVELMMREDNDKWILKYKSNGITIAKTKAFRQIDPNVPYNVAMSFDGTDFHVFVDFAEVIRLRAPVLPSGIMGYQARNTTGRFKNVCLMESGGACFANTQK
ncbi:MAG TPA: hypothetical protein VLH08_21675, partial [Acidobacteriota bacterium]|nr:hypothetical protein [Acidobacteriota bacterium]